MPPSDSEVSGAACVCVGDIGVPAVAGLLEKYGLALKPVAEGMPIEASFWGEPEAGITGRSVFARADTPVHSVLHETAHIVCMPGSRRRALHRNAGGDDLEESAVCYLQIVLADYLAGLGRERLMRDMDTWGYSFRLGSTARWFADDADDAREFLLRYDILDAGGQPTWRLRR